MARTVEIDTTGGPGFGLEQYKAHDFLLPKEIVLTFDDGPWPTTRPVLAALAAECVKATFFTIGKNAVIYPEILKEVVAAGHTIGTHPGRTPTCATSASRPRRPRRRSRRFSAVKIAMGTGSPAPFFRFPALQDPPELVSYLGTRNIAIVSMDLDSFDFKFRAPDSVIKNVLAKLEKKGKGIVLLHDFQAGTAKAAPELLAQLKAHGYKVVHMRAKAPVTTFTEYDTLAQKEFKGPMQLDRPTSTVVKTIDSN